MAIGKCTHTFRGIFSLGREGVEERGLHGRILKWRSLPWEERIYMKGAQDFLILLKTKNNEKINMKMFFSTESKEQH